MKKQHNSKHAVAAMAAGLTCLLAFAVQAASPLRTPAGSPVLKDRNETPEQHDARMAWWREAKFGMYAVKRAGYGAKAAPLSVSVDGAVILDLAPDKLGDAWTSFTSPVFLLTAGSHTLTFTLGKAEGDVMDLIDNVAIKYCK